jgi:hypothetical protein
MTDVPRQVRGYLLSVELLLGVRLLLAKQHPRGPAHVLAVRLSKKSGEP